MLAVHENLLRALGILCGGVAPSHKLLCARREQFQVREVAIQEGQIRDVTGIELNGNVPRDPSSVVLLRR